MDIVWDKGALSSIKTDKDRYVAVMKSLLAPNFSYGLWTVVYDGQLLNAFCRNMPEAVIQKLFGKGIKVRCLDKDTPKTVDFCTSPITGHLWHLME
ncbi:unnamed protein product [Ixodes pacificus]